VSSTAGAIHRLVVDLRDARVVHLDEQRKGSTRVQRTGGHHLGLRGMLSPCERA